MRCFRLALELDPDFLRAKQNLALLDADLNQSGLVATERDFSPSTVLQESTSSIEGWEKQWGDEVVLQFQAGHADLALNLADDLLLQWPESGVLVCRVADLYRASGDIEGGIQLLNSHLSLSPSSHDVWACLGEFILMTGDFEKASWAFDKGDRGSRECAPQYIQMRGTVCTA